MAAPRNRKHLLVREAPSADPYTPHKRKMDPPIVPVPPNRGLHARTLGDSLRQASAESQAARDSLDISIHGAKPGVYVQFDGWPGIDLKLESLEDQRKGIELVTVQIVRPPNKPAVQRATVFVPEGQLKHFLTRFEQYATEKTKKKGEPRHKDMVDRIASLRKAALSALWTDSLDEFPADDQKIWWEVWLRRHDHHELERLLEFADAIGAGMVVGERRLAFEDRIVVLVHGTREQLAGSVDVLNDLAEVRRAPESAAFFVKQSPQDQAAWADDLKKRIQLPGKDAPAVCVLDTGVNRGHPLLQGLIDTADATAVDSTWGPGDDGGGRGNMGHGTEMAGLAVYGDLADVLPESGTVVVRNRVESVKILPPTGANRPDLYGAITAQAVARPEIVAPHRPRVFSLAITSTDGRDRGQPTSWSAAIDALAVGRTFDSSNQGLVYLDEGDEIARRLIVVSAGNVAPDRIDVQHLDRSDVEPVHDPAQAWNALTVGATTEKADLCDPALAGWSVVAARGDLSPWSTTSVAFGETWPIKPDVVFEGGNIAHLSGDFAELLPELSLLSTYFKPAEKLFVLSNATSAATAQVARMAAIIRAEYPDFWPETVRAVVVHSARWTGTMNAHFDGASNKTARARLVRRYGFGVPSLKRALRSANDALTLVVQSAIRPFTKGQMREMHVHELPWPKGVLGELGEAWVRLRVTLSYFIEPNPGRRGWRKRHRYASHGLRFEVKSPTDLTIDEFRKRVNSRALEEEEEKPATGGDAGDWHLGEKARSKGSIHTDIWEGTAQDLADRGVIGIYPVSGWWKDQPKRDRSDLGARYALVVTLETDEQNVDIWTPVAEEIGVPVDIVEP